MSRPATADDVPEICMSLPEVQLSTSRGERPTYELRGKGFLLDA